MKTNGDTMTRAWLKTLDEVIGLGVPVAPRGEETFEILQHSMQVDMRYPVLLAPTRKLSEKFLAAEALWILSGDDRVETIAAYNKNIAQFSDDGKTFFGAYGPRIMQQIDFVVGKLVEDPATRQAGLTTWRPNPPKTKDVPCTIAMFFNIRGGLLNMHVFMRSSDVWLGVPYDVFNFAMIAHLVCARVNTERMPDNFVRPGTLYLTAASRHLYKRNFEQAGSVLANDAPWASSNPVPSAMAINEKVLFNTLSEIRDGNENAKWWKD